MGYFNGPDTSNWPIARYIGTSVGGMTWTINGNNYEFGNNDAQREQPVRPEDLDQLLQKAGFVQVSAAVDSQPQKPAAKSKVAATAEQTDATVVATDQTSADSTDATVIEAEKPARPAKKSAASDEADSGTK